ncbi:MAG: glycosyltransferase family 2 protein [Acidimicrobiales bacterium]
MTTLTIVMPVYNERETLRTALDRLLAVEMPVPTEVLVVDDGSTDGCTETIADLVDAGAVRLVVQDPNQGKGKALRRGIAEASGVLLTILDADLEYDPADFPALLEPILEGDACGLRRLVLRRPRRLLLLVRDRQQDARPVGLAAVRRGSPTSRPPEGGAHRHLARVDLQSNGFGIEAELTGKLLAAGSASSRCRSPIGRAAARRARRSSGPTGWRPCGSWPGSGCGGSDGGAGACRFGRRLPAPPRRPPGSGGHPGGGLPRLLPDRRLGTTDPAGRLRGGRPLLRAERVPDHPEAGPDLVRHDRIDLPSTSAVAASGAWSRPCWPPWWRRWRCALYVDRRPLAHRRGARLTAIGVRSGIGALLYVSNYQQAGRPFVPELSHTWSLSIEGQYFACCGCLCCSACTGSAPVRCRRRSWWC